MNNTTKHIQTCQQNKFAQNLITQKPQIIQVAPDNLKLQSVNWDLVDKCIELDTTQRGVLNSILMVSNKHKVIFISQSSIADYNGLTREWVNKIIKHLAQLGLIKKTYRFFKTCLYKISDIFLNLEVRSKLSDILYNLKYVPLYLITLNANCDITINAGNIDQQAQFTLYKLGIIRSITSTVSHVKLKPFLLKRNRTVYDNQRCYVLSCKSSHIKEVSMLTEAQKNELILEAQRRITNPEILKAAKIAEVNGKLTRYGLLKLTSYPVDAVLYALNVMRCDKKLKDPFGYIAGICRKYCSENGIQPDFSVWDTCVQLFKIPYGAKLIEPKPVAAKPAVVAKPVTVQLDIKKERDNWHREFETNTEFREAAQNLGLNLASNPFLDPKVTEKKQEPLKEEVKPNAPNSLGDILRNMFPEAGNFSIEEKEVIPAVLKYRQQCRHKGIALTVAYVDQVKMVGAKLIPQELGVQNPLNFNDNDS